MADSEIPPDAPPPSYAQATGGSSTNRPSRLQPRNNIPVDVRRSMEDENRPLPEGWVRQFDAKHTHQFFVDTRTDPPRSIWHHPYDDDEYLDTLSPEERRKIEAQKKTPTRRDTETWSTDGSVESPTSPNEKKHGGLFSDKKSKSDVVDSGAGEGSSAQAAQQQQHAQEKPKLGRRLKDKLTGTTHEQRVAEREQRAREEEEQYQQYLAMRGAMRRAYDTGEPQFVGRDHTGKEVYVEPPQGYGYGAGPRGVDGNGVYVNPYSQGPYTNPNARFVRPAGPYSRPYGGGYGGGYGLPIAGGLAGGLLLGGLLGGFGA